jgi:hypothetical protein
MGGQVILDRRVESHPLWSLLTLILLARRVVVLDVLHTQSQPPARCSRTKPPTTSGRS